MVFWSVLAFVELSFPLLSWMVVDSLKLTALSAIPLCPVILQAVSMRSLLLVDLLLVKLALLTWLSTRWWVMLLLPVAGKWVLFLILRKKTTHSLWSLWTKEFVWWKQNWTLWPLISWCSSCLMKKSVVVSMFTIFPAKCSLAVAMFRTTLHIAMRMDLSSLLTRLRLISLLWTLKIKLIWMLMVQAPKTSMTSWILCWLTLKRCLAWRIRTPWSVILRL